MSAGTSEGRLTDEELAEIEARADAATEGPWDDAEMRRWPGRWDVWDREGRKCIAEVLWERDAEFIAAARSDVPRLLAAVRGQGEALQRVRDELAKLRESRQCLGAADHDYESFCDDVDDFLAAVGPVR